MNTDKNLENTIAKGIVKGSLILTLLSIASTIIIGLILSGKADKTTTP